MSYKLNFRFKSLEVNMVYGFMVKPFEKEFEKILSSIEDKKYIRDGWNTSYKINSMRTELIQNYNIDEPQEIVLIRDDDTYTNKWPSSHENIRLIIIKTMSIRKDGIGTITLTLKTIDEENVYYNTSDLLRMLMLVPRTYHCSDEYETSKVECDIKKPEGIEIHDDTWNSFSIPYKIFVKMMSQKLPFDFIIWQPLFNGEKAHILTEEGIEELSSVGDSQIPYISVFAKIPYKKYKQAFLEDDVTNIKDMQKERLKYSKEISAILGRWLNENNFKYASLEYWNRNGQMGEDYCYETKFMNSLNFVTFSGMVSLSLYPDLDEAPFSKYIVELMKKPVFITHETILRYIEFSRLRWHHAITINRGIDNLINSIALEDQTHNYLVILERLIKIEKQIVLYQQDINSYLWDSSVGSYLSKFLHEEIINKIEVELTNKLNIVRKLSNDKLSVVRTRNYIETLLKSNRADKKDTSISNE